MDGFKDLFAKSGTVSGICLELNRVTGRSRGFVFGVGAECEGQGRSRRTRLWRLFSGLALEEHNYQYRGVRPPGDRCQSDWNG